MAFLNKGDKAPDFQVKDQDGKMVALKDFLGHKVILYFYPKADTPGCTAESCNLRDNYDDLLGRGYKIIGVSPDTVEKQKKFAEKYNLPFSLLADTELEVIKAYGAWGTKSMYGKSYEGLLRTTYVIDEKGKIEKVITSVKTKDHAAQILQAMEND
ncbi:MAG TPA: thioredoxin-dependent thiol peroxidase [Bacteroidales bacterium]|nr:thioredoxin-dependent thiol peroxidase [Bacteroidales bacterium]